MSYQVTSQPLRSYGAINLSGLGSTDPPLSAKYSSGNQRGICRRKDELISIQIIILRNSPFKPSESRPRRCSTISYSPCMCIRYDSTPPCIASKLAIFATAPIRASLVSSFVAINALIEDIAWSLSCRIYFDGIEIPEIVDLLAAESNRIVWKGAS